MKYLIGIVVGLFCTLVVACLCSFCFKMDLVWYTGLIKPTFVPSGVGFTLLVGMTYFSTICAIARIVAKKRWFPSMLIFLFLGISSVLFVYTFFTLKLVYLSLFFIGAATTCSLLVTVRFMQTDMVSLIVYIPSFVFNCFCFVTVFAIVMSN